MKNEKPILMCGDMVQALLRAVDPKTQTRRIVKHQPIKGDVYLTKDKNVWAAQTDRSVVTYFNCKYGGCGDWLWVKETFMPKPQGQTGYYYRASLNVPSGKISQWKPSIFMPRAASRIDLEIVQVRVDRLQDISEADAIAEGIKHTGDRIQDGKKTSGQISVQRVYRNLWNAINLKPKPVYKTWHHPGLSKAEDTKSKEIIGYVSFPWSLEDFKTAYPKAIDTYRGKPLTVTPNPWVWVITFKRQRDAAPPIQEKLAARRET